MTNEKATIKDYLAYLGLLPFILALPLVYYDLLLPTISSADLVIDTYGLVIAVFLSGAHWGQHLSMHGSRWRMALPVLSNIIVIALWLGMLLASSEQLLILVEIAFLIILFVDYKLYQAEVISRRYFKTRVHCTAVVLLVFLILGWLQ